MSNLPLNFSIHSSSAGAGSGSPRNIIDEEWLVGRRGVETPYMHAPLHREVSGEVVAGISGPRIYLGVIAEQIRRPLIGLASMKP